MLIDINKKCSICKEFVSLEKDNVVWNKSYMHFDCLAQKEYGKKSNKLSLEQIIENIKIIQKENESHVQQTLLRERFYRWLQQSYSIVVIPKYFFVKIDSVITGEYKGLTIPIPLEDIFDMWKRKKNDLDRIALNNTKKGNNIDSIGRLSYDLAIIINKYDSYLKWKAQNKIIEQNEKEAMEIKNNKIDYSKINKSENNLKINDEINIIDLIDDI